MNETRRRHAKEFAGYLQRLARSIVNNIDPKTEKVEITKELGEEIAERLESIAGDMLQWSEDEWYPYMPIGPIPPKDGKESDEKSNDEPDS